MEPVDHTEQTIVVQLPESNPGRSSYLWHVVYDDETTLDEIDAEGKDHGWAEVDLARVQGVQLLPQRPGLKGHALIRSGNAVPDFRRRTSLSINLATGESFTPDEATLHMIGFVASDDSCVYAVIFYDGSFIITDDLDAINPTGLSGAV